LLKPSRSCGNTRLYSDDDLKRLEIILNLVRDLGVNLAGVEVVLNMRAKIVRIETEVQSFMESFRQEFFSGREEEFEARKRSLVPVTPSKIVKVDEPE
ncbi:MAG: MerR family transcriptional regulator, partial [Candidatus Aminicenantes bacterium]|nr:MerR family transcriptional regulator [Candidatus Aminicenantes bacterium]